MAKKKNEPEYLLRIFRHQDERTNKKGVVFAIETIAVFTNFKYEILLEEKRNNKEIELRIVGLHAPSLLMPGKGPARGSREYFDLKGTYTVRINKMGKEINEFRVEVSPNRIAVKDVSENPFIIARMDPLAVTKV